jgi:hypothetical protein
MIGLNPSTESQPWKREDHVTNDTNSDLVCKGRAVVERTRSNTATKAMVKSLILPSVGKVRNSSFPALGVPSSGTSPAPEAMHSEKLSHRSGSQKHRVIQKMWHQEMHFLC